MMKKQRGFIIDPFRFGTARDPYWEDVVFLLQGAEPDGSTYWTDLSVLNNPVARVGTHVSNVGADAKFGNSGITFTSARDSVLVAGNTTNFKFLHDGATKWTIDGWIIPGGVGYDHYLLDTAAGTTVNHGLFLGYNASNSTLTLQIYYGSIGNYIALATGFLNMLPVNGTYRYFMITCDPSLGSLQITFISAGGSTQSSFSTITTDSSDSSHALCIGGYNTASPVPGFNGSIGAIRITKNHVRSYVEPTGLFLYETSPAALDAFTTDLWSACWLGKVIRTWAGACIRIRRSSDNAEQDIGFVGYAVDSAAAAAFAGAGDAFVTKVYDQSGNGNDIVQATSSKQPRCVASGVWDGYMRFDGSDDSMASTNTSGGSNLAFTAFMKSDLRTTTSTYMILEHTADANTNDGADFFYDYPSSIQTTGAAVTRNSSADFIGRLLSAQNYFDGAVSAIRADVSQASVFDRIKVYKALVSSSNGNINTGSPTGAFANANYYFGARAGTSLFAPQNAYGWVIYQAASGLSDANVLAINAALAAV